MEIKLSQSSVFDLVRLPKSVEPNPRLEFDRVRLSSISERSTDYAGERGGEGGKGGKGGEGVTCSYSKLEARVSPKNGY